MYHACLDRRLGPSRLVWSPGPGRDRPSTCVFSSCVARVEVRLWCCIVRTPHVSSLCAISPLIAYADSRMTETFGNREYILSKPGIFCFCFIVSAEHSEKWPQSTLRFSSLVLVGNHPNLWPMMTSTCPVSQTPNVRSHHLRQACTATFIVKSGLQVHFFWYSSITLTFVCLRARPFEDPKSRRWGLIFSPIFGRVYYIFSHILLLLYFFIGRPCFCESILKTQFYVSHNWTHC